LNPFWELALSVSLLFGLSVVVTEDASEVWSGLLKVKLIPEGDDCWDTLSLVASSDELSSLTSTAQEGFRSSISISIRSASGTANKLLRLGAYADVKSEFLGEGGVIMVFGF